MIYDGRYFFIRKLLRKGGHSGRVFYAVDGFSLHTKQNNFNVPGGIFVRNHRIAGQRWKCPGYALTVGLVTTGAAGSIQRCAYIAF